MKLYIAITLLVCLVSGNDAAVTMGEESMEDDGQGIISKLISAIFPPLNEFSEEVKEVVGRVTNVNANLQKPYKPYGYRPNGYRPNGYRPDGYRPDGYRPYNNAINKDALALVGLLGSAVGKEIDYPSTVTKEPSTVRVTVTVPPSIDSVLPNRILRRRSIGQLAPFYPGAIGYYPQVPDYSVVYNSMQNYPQPMQNYPTDIAPVGYGMNYTSYNQTLNQTKPKPALNVSLPIPLGLLMKLPSLPLPLPAVAPPIELNVRLPSTTPRPSSTTFAPTQNYAYQHGSVYKPSYNTPSYESSYHYQSYKPSKYPSPSYRPSY